MPGSVAPLLQGYQRRYKNQRFPAGFNTVEDGGYQATNPVTVEILVDGIWTDITPDVQTRGTNPIQITKGQSDVNTAANPGSCTFQINNRSGKYSPRNTASPYYGKIGRNTQIRVSVPNGTWANYRFWGEATAWPQNWDTTGRDVWVDMQASGLLRRLAQTQTAVSSTIYYALAAGTPAVPVTPIYGYTQVPPIAYWPLEDGAASTQLASALPGGSPMTVNGTPTLANYTGFNCSKALPTMGTASFSGAIPIVQNFDQWQIRMLMGFPAAGQLTDQTVLFRVYCTGNTVGLMDIIYRSGGGLSYRSYNQGGGLINDTGPLIFGLDGTIGRIQLDTSGSVHTLSYINIGQTTYAAGAQGTEFQFTIADIGNPRAIVIAPNRDQPNLAVGHVSVQNQTTSLADIAPALIAFDGESADTRVWRLLAQQGFTFSSTGDFGQGALMGPQLPSTLSNLLQECYDADLGFIYESTGLFGLGYYNREAYYQTFSGRNDRMVLDYALGQAADIPKPLDDDRYTLNDATVTRKNGSAARSTVTSGTLSTANPPLGVGQYSQSFTVNVHADSQLADAAGWRTHLGTWDAPRYPQVSVNLAHSSFGSGAATAATRAQVLSAFLGDSLGIRNLPAQTGAGSADIVNLAIIGMTESIDQFEHKLTFVCAPHDPYLVAQCDDALFGHADTDGSTLAADLTTTQALVSLATTNPASPLWTEQYYDFPFDLMVSGERMTVLGPGRVINTDPSFAGGLTYWTPLNSTAAVDSTYDLIAGQTGLGSSTSILVTPNGSAFGGLNAAVSTGVGSITPNSTYHVSGWVYSPQGWTDVRMCADWYDASGTFLSTGVGSASSCSAGVWTPLTQDLTAPASASQAYLRFRWGSTPPTTVQFWLSFLIMVDDSTVLSASPQNYTVLRSVNGVVKTHATGESVALYQPAIAAW